MPHVQRAGSHQSPLPHLDHLDRFYTHAVQSAAGGAQLTQESYNAYGLLAGNLVIMAFQPNACASRGERFSQNECVPALTEMPKKGMG